MADVEPGVKSRRKPRAERLPDTADGVDIAMHAVASGKALPDVARRLLEEQSRLVRAQTSELRTRQVGERVRALLWGVLAIAAAAILVLFGALLVRAARTDALVVQSFRVPPSMQARGLTGEVVATQLLDKLAEMQEQSESTRAASSYANNWEDDLKIDIPNTGASTDQIWKLLRGWLGKETRISGEVIETSGGLTLTARVGSQPGRRFVNKSGDLDALVAQGAELIYRQTQPYRHTVFLSNDPKRADERLALLQGLTGNESAIERKWAYNGLSVIYRSRGEFGKAIAAAKKALAIDAAMIPSWNNLGSAHGDLGHDQSLVDYYRQAQSLTVGKEFDTKVVKANHCRTEGEIAERTRDPRGLDDAADCLELIPGSMTSLSGGFRFSAAIFRHDIAPKAVQPAPRTAPSDDIEKLQTADRRLRVFLATRDRQALDAAVRGVQEAGPRFAKSAKPNGYFQTAEPIYFWPAQAEAMALVGKQAEAEALISKTPLDCYNCVRTRGLVAEARGDRRAAQLHYLAAAKLGPRLPAAFADWGRLLGQAGRFESAEVKLKEAARLAPNWADPLKIWGDLLAAQGKRGEALAKYDAALKLAPNWVDLRAARARVAVR